MTEEQAKAIADAITEKAKEVAEWIVETFNKIWEAIKKIVKPLIAWLRKLPGYKRHFKREQLKYFESISSGKSNNWRKMHGLPLIRNAI